MNFLAHFLLSGHDSEVIFGNLLEDFVSGRIDHPRFDSYSDKIKLGIKLHRQIDTFIDTNPEVKVTKSFFYPKFGKFSSAIIDVVFDHTLSLNWNEYSDENLHDFRKRIYNVFIKYDNLQPYKMKMLTDSMINYDWLKNYQYIYGIERAFCDLNKRTNVNFDFRDSITILNENFDEINRVFNDFFPKIQLYCANYLAENGQI